jgi:hypothetical protein
MTKHYTGSCHCGKVRIEADLDLASGTGRCNCTMCAKTRSWAIIAQPSAFKLVAGKDDLSDYQFGSNSIHHYFCKHCGVRPFSHGNLPALGGEFYTINVATLDDLTDDERSKLPVRFSDGRGNNWMNPPAHTAHL